MDFAFDKAFYEISVLILLAAAVGVVGLLARQPLIVAFIFVGVLAGPDALGIASSEAFIQTLSEISIAVLLFLVGLKLDLTLVRSLGKVAVATGLGQVGFTAVFGFLICLALGIDWLTSVYIAVALTFSSTIIIVKLLSDKREIGALHGKIALGFLIVQDIFVVLAMVVLSAVGVGAAEGGGGLGQVARLVVGSVIFLAFIAAFIRYAAEPLVRFVSRSPELLVISAVGWAVGLAALADAIGFGKELGGLLAGVSLASTPYRDAIGSRLTSLRDFLLLFFFIALGAGLDLSTLGAQVGPAILLSLFVLIGNPIIVMAIMGYMGYRSRTGFLAGLTVAQISEFSLIFMAMGLALGHVSESAVGLVTLVGLVTIALSVYMITWSHQLWERLGPVLRMFDPKPRRLAGAESRGGGDDDDAPPETDVIVFGLGRLGARLLTRLEDAGYRVMGVDLDPRVVRHQRSRGRNVIYGDATEQDFWSDLPLERARWIVLTVPYDVIKLTETDAQSGLLAAIATHRYQGRVALVARDAAQATLLEGKGVDLVLQPFDDAATAASERILAADDHAPAPAAPA